jgi:organic radical activating enzyme
MPYLNRVVTEQDKEKHEKWRCNYEAMKLLLDLHPDYQLKPVISDEKDLEEVKKLQKELGVPNEKVYLMSEGINKEQVESRRKWLSELCQKEGYNFTDRLHILIYGDQRGV